MYLGIDFGTTFSQTSTLYLDQPLLLLSPGEYGIPSEFYYDRDNGILIGQDALDAGQGVAAVNLKSEIKMDLAHSFTVDGRTFQAKEIVREIYKTLVNKAKKVARTRKIDTKIEGIVISVPAKFSMQERSLIYEAARHCLPDETLPVQDIIKEPVAAALSYYKTELESNRYVLVYDLGGGTCDVALVRSDHRLRERFEVIDTDMVRLGGRDWDKALAEHITDIVEHKANLKIRGNAGFEEKIRRAAISVKYQLSDPERNRAMARIEINGRIITVPISRNIFDEVTAHLLNKTLECLQDIYDKHHHTCSIDEIICVGGSSNMLQVEEGIRHMFPKCKVRLYEPEHAVVNGTAIYASLLKDIPGQRIVQDISSFSYGVEIYENYDKDPTRKVISNIIKKGEQLPVSGSKKYSPIQDNQKFIRFDVYESDSEAEQYEITEEKKRYIGSVDLNLPADAKKTWTLICGIKLNDKGLLEVQASEQGGNQVEAQFRLAQL